MLVMCIAILFGVISWAVPMIWERVRKEKNLQEEIRGDGTTLIDYGIYSMSRKEWILTFIVSGSFFGLIGYVFYHQLLISLLFGLFGIGYTKVRTVLLLDRRKKKLNIQFKQGLYCLSTALSSGKSIETAFHDALIDLKRLYPDPSCLIIQEFEFIVRRIENGEQVEVAVASFAKRACLSDISSFADVLITCKRTGGNLVEVIRRTTGIIGEKLEIQQDIAVMIAQKKFESQVLLFAPIMVVALLGMSSPDYMHSLYQGIGRFIMTCGLLVLGLCYWMIRKIMNIKV